MGNLTEFTLTFAPGPGGGARWKAHAVACPSPGVIGVTEYEHRMAMVVRSATLTPDCALDRGVLDVLAPGRATATRSMLAQACP
jgi:hypothetical protein